MERYRGTQSRDLTKEAGNAVEFLKMGLFGDAGTNICGNERSLR